MTDSMAHDVKAGLNDEDLSTAGSRPNCSERENYEREGQEEDSLLLWLRVMSVCVLHDVCMPTCV